MLTASCVDGRAVFTKHSVVPDLEAGEFPPVC